ncbi:MAG: hypothetical protein HOA17_07610 [Candidatus Melainabacteria bacterium]|jgi:hypothetical protein|nr:hypothetical protein [Candidatus Melainabacteria bacterium]
MTNNTITNLHKQAKANLLDNTLVQDIRAKIQEIASKLPDLLGRVDITGHFRLKHLKQTALKRMNKKRGKFKLALESLGWGTLVDLLESAFCGQEVDVWV